MSISQTNGSQTAQPQKQTPDPIVASPTQPPSIQQYKNRMTDMSSVAKATALEDAVNQAGGRHVFADTAAACAMIDALPNQAVEPGDKERYKLALRTTGIGQLLANADDSLAMQQIDIAMHAMTTSSGLSYSAATRVVYDLFSACGIHTAQQDRMVTRNANAQEPSVMREMVFPLSQPELNSLVNASMSLMDDLIDREQAQNNPDKDDDYASACRQLHTNLRRLTDMGEPAGFYMVGVCNMFGYCGTAKNIDKAVQYLTIAAADGHSGAAALLGDIYSGSAESSKHLDYTAAYDYYTRPGAMSLLKNQRMASLATITAQRHDNVILLVCAGALVALQVLCLLVLNNVLPEWSDHWVFGGVIAAISAVWVGLGVIFHIGKPYNGVRAVIAGVIVLWLVFLLSLLL